MYEVTRQISADPEQVWSFVADLDAWGEMLPTMSSVTRLGPDGPITVGTRFAVRQPSLPRSTYQVTRWDPGRGFIWVATSPGIHTIASHWLTTLDEGTRLVLTIEWSGPLAFAIRRALGTKVVAMMGREADTFDQLATQ